MIIISTKYVILYHFGVLNPKFKSSSFYHLITENIYVNVFRNVTTLMRYFIFQILKNVKKL